MDKYTIATYKNGDLRNSMTGTLKELTEAFAYTLECGRSWEHEKGNHKISLKPRSIESLVKNLNWAVDNAAANHCSNKWYELV